MAIDGVTLTVRVVNEVMVVVSVALWPLVVVSVALRPLVVVPGLTLAVDVVSAVLVVEVDEVLGPYK